MSPLSLANDAVTAIAFGKVPLAFPPDRLCGVAHDQSVTVDDRGIRKRRTFLLFGTPFDLTWDQIDSWDSVEAVLVSSQSQQVVSRVLELRTVGKDHHVGWSGSAADYDALIEEIRLWAPDKHKPSILRQTSAIRETGAVTSHVE